MSWIESKLFNIKTLLFNINECMMTKDREKNRIVSKLVQFFLLFRSKQLHSQIFDSKDGIFLQMSFSQRDLMQSSGTEESLWT